MIKKSHFFVTNEIFLDRETSHYHFHLLGHNHVGHRKTNITIRQTRQVEFNDKYYYSTLN